MVESGEEEFEFLLEADTSDRISSWANSNVGWVSDSITHAGVGFRPSTSTYSVLRLIGTSYLASEDEDYRDVSFPIVDMQKVHRMIRGYAMYDVGAFKNFALAEVEEMNLEFNLKIAGEADVQLL